MTGRLLVTSIVGMASFAAAGTAAGDRGRSPFPAGGDGCAAGFVTSRAGEEWSPEDTDGDGLSDEWEIHYFGFIHSQAAEGDPDGDGSDNLHEFEQGTDPMSEVS